MSEERKNNQNGLDIHIKCQKKGKTTSVKERIGKAEKGEIK